jgi:hypothetical protein
LTAVGGKTHPNIPESIPLLQTQIRVPRTAIPLNLTRPVAPADRLQFLCSQHQADGYHHDGDQGLDDDILRQLEAGVAEEDGVFVGRVASVKLISVGSLALWGLVVTYAWANRTRPNNVTRREKKLMVMVGEVVRGWGWGRVPAVVRREEGWWSPRIYGSP